MTTVSTTASPINGTTTGAAGSKTALGQLNSGDFLKLMTTQLKQQDPFNPTDNTQMLAQMAQFSSLSQSAEMNAGIGDLNKRMTEISGKLDALVAAQLAANKMAAAAQTGATSASTTAAPDAAATDPAATSSVAA